MRHTHECSSGHGNTDASFTKAFAIGVGLNLAFVVIEVVFGFLAQSLALVADAGHNLSDVLGLVLAWCAAALSQRAPTERRTYGWKSSSILAALLQRHPPSCFSRRDRVGSDTTFTQSAGCRGKNNHSGSGHRHRHQRRHCAHVFLRAQTRSEHAAEPFCTWRRMLRCRSTSSSRAGLFLSPECARLIRRSALSSLWLSFRGRSELVARISVDLALQGVPEEVGVPAVRLIWRAFPRHRRSCIFMSGR